MKRRRNYAFLFAVALCLAPTIAADADNAAGLVAKLKASLAAIETVQGTYRTYFSHRTRGGENSIEPGGKPVPGAIRNSEGQVLYSEFEWAWQAMPYREAIDGRWGFVDDGRMRYQPAAFAFDGAILRTFSRDAKAGQVKPMDNTFTVWRNPLHLAGIGFGIAPRRNLDELLTGARLVSKPGTAPHLKLLENEYRDYEQDLQLNVWLDVEHGHLPRRIEIFEQARRFMTWEIVNDGITEMAPSVWVPLRGSETGYYVADYELENGMTKEKLESLDVHARNAILAKSKVIAKPLGFGTQTYILDRQTVRLNREIPQQRFILDLPEGTRLFDTTHNPALQYEFKAHRTDEQWREIVARAEQRAKAQGNRDAAQQALIGQAAVNFPAKSVWIHSKPLRLADLAGRLILLDFWAEWCGPCRDSLKGLAEAHHQREDPGITVIGIHTAAGDRAAIDKVIDELHLEYPIVIDTPTDGTGWGTFFGRYAVSAIPHAILIDRQGKIVAAGEPGEVYLRARKIAAESK